jgi:predicted AAA+ superfamily ATPase
LELSRKAGDSLAGRFLKFHIFPFTLAELSNRRRTIKNFMGNPLEGFDDAPAGETAQVFKSLWELSGFPEPFLKGKKTFWSSWSAAYGQQIVRDDLRTVADIRNLDMVETLFALLPSRVASPLSMNNLAGDLQVAFDTVKSWLLLFDSFYLTFRISPWTQKISRSILKEKKIYLFNFPVIDDEAARFENLAALEFLRAVEAWNDHGWGNFSLHYLRNKDKQEVDFLLAENNRPFLIAETKLSDDAPAASLIDFQKLFNIPAVQLVRKEGVRKVNRNGKNSILVVTAHRWLSALP